MEGKIIFFEGIDNCFKTTNIKKLCSYFYKKGEPFHVLKYSGIKEAKGIAGLEFSKKMYDQMFQIIENSKNQGINIILDRSHLGENVYSRYRGYSPDYIWELEDKYSNVLKGAFLFFLYDEIDNILNREDGLSISINKDDKEEELKSFFDSFNKSRIQNKKRIFVNYLSRESVFNKIKEFLNEKTKDKLF